MRAPEELTSRIVIHGGELSTDAFFFPFIERKKGVIQISKDLMVLEKDLNDWRKLSVLHP